MRGQSKCPIRFEQPNLVGTIHSAGGFYDARRMRGAGLDAVEVRVDLLKPGPGLEDVARLPFPVILTVRHPGEGGGAGIPEARRRELYLALLPAAAALDIELRSVRTMSGVLDQARRARKAVILSFHDFAGTPSAAKLRGVVRRAREAGADVVKIATVTNTAAEAARLVGLMDLLPGGPLALMGMGRWGRALRLLMVQRGSALNYGWLHRPQVPGQWSARRLCEFRRKLAEK